jgi:predicted aminopeptidase
MSRRITLGSPVTPALLAAAALVSGCFTIDYTLQAGAGQFQLLTSARPIDEVLQSDRTPRRVRRLLGEVAKVKAFGETQGLRPTSSYQRYAQLDRPAAVWAVSACPELSLEAKVWRFPIAGSVPYLGWFERRAAEDFAAGLKAEGYDVDVRGASAYSTLGWFNDPVLSSMLGSGPEALGWLADVVLHESVHATVYVAGQSLFNEGLASFAGTGLSRAYLAGRLGPGARETLAWAEAEERYRLSEARLHQAAVDLEAVYRDPALTTEEKRARKAALFAALQAERKAKHPMNNAALAQHLAYRTGLGGFAQVLESCSGAWPCFFHKLSTVRSADFAKPQQEDLDALLARVAQAPAN